MASSGGLSPADTVEETLQTGLHHLYESVELCLLKNFYGGLLLSAAGLGSLILATGIPEHGEKNPGLVRLLQGSTFPLGLVLVYFLGAELYTGYPMWLTMTALHRKGQPLRYLRAILASLTGNLASALFWSIVQSYLTRSITQEPFADAVTEQIDSDITAQPFHVIFLRAIGCGFMVTVAMMLGTQNRDGISKALGLWLPFFISTVCKFPHTVEYMYLGSTGMLVGAKLGVGMFVWKCLVPVILGNTFGGAFTGAYNYYVFVVRHDDKDEGGQRWLDGHGEDE